MSKMKSETACTVKHLLCVHTDTENKKDVPYISPVILRDYYNIVILC